MPAHGLIIEEQFSNPVFGSREIWEIRRRTTMVRGSIALISRPDSAVVALATISDVKGPYHNLEQIHAELPRGSYLHHPNTNQERHGSVGPLHAWVITDVDRFPNPISSGQAFNEPIWTRLMAHTRKLLSLPTNESGAPAEDPQADRDELSTSPFTIEKADWSEEDEFVDSATYDQTTRADRPADAGIRNLRLGEVLRVGTPDSVLPTYADDDAMSEEVDPKLEDDGLGGATVEISQKAASAVDLPPLDSLPIGKYRNPGKIDEFACRQLLVTFREDVIREEFPNAPREEGILRKNLLEQLVIEDVKSWDAYRKWIPKEMQVKTSKAQEQRYGELIFRIIEAITDERGF